MSSLYVKFQLTSTPPSNGFWWGFLFFLWQGKNKVKLGLEFDKKEYENWHTPPNHTHLTRPWSFGKFWQKMWLHRCFQLICIPSNMRGNVKNNCSRIPYPSSTPQPQDPALWLKKGGNGYKNVLMGNLYTEVLRGSLRKTKLWPLVSLFSFEEFDKNECISQI